MREDSIDLGTLVRPVGLKGDVKLAPSPNFWDESLDSKRLEIVSPGGGPRPVRVLSSRGAKGGLVLRLEGVADRNAAEALRDCSLRLRGEPDVPLPEIARPWQVLGMRVFVKRGEPLGEVTGLQVGRGQPLLQVKGAERDYDIPFVPPIICDIDWEDGRIEIDPPPGLLEL